MAMLAQLSTPIDLMSRPPSLVSDAGSSSTASSIDLISDFEPHQGARYRQPPIHAGAPVILSPTSTCMDAASRPPHALMRIRSMSMPGGPRVLLSRPSYADRNSVASFDSLPEEDDTDTQKDDKMTLLPDAGVENARPRPAHRLSTPTIRATTVSPRPSSAGPLDSSCSLEATRPRMRMRTRSTGHAIHKRRSMARAMTEPFSTPVSKKRSMLVQELVDTERSYVQTLTDIDTYYVAPLMEASTSDAPIVDKRTVHDIFINFQDVFVLAREVLRRLEQGSSPVVIKEEPAWDALSPQQPQQMERAAAVQTGLVGALLLPLCPFFKCYALFVQHFSKTLSVLHSQERDNAAFAAFLTEKRAKGHARGIELGGMLLNIVQRIPRYRLLLGDILTKTESTHPDHEPLTEAYHLIEQVATFLDAAIKAHEATQRLLDLQRCFVNLDMPLIAPGRKLVKQGTLIKVCRRDEQPRTFFLFSDMIVYAVSSHPQLDAKDDDDDKVPVRTGSNNMPMHRWSRAMSMNSIAEARLAISASVTAVAPSVAAAQDMPSYYNPKMLPIKDVTVISTEGDWFELRSPQRSFAVSARSAHAKEAWIEAIRATKEEWLGARHTLQRRDSDSEDEAQSLPLQAPTMLRTQSAPSRTGLPLESPESPDVQDAAVSTHLKVALDYSAPVWVPDYKCSACMHCHESFTLFRRRHHCRLCGHVVCASCSSQNFVIPPTASQPSRVARACDACHASCFKDQAMRDADADNTTRQLARLSLRSTLV